MKTLKRAMIHKEVGNLAVFLSSLLFWTITFYTFSPIIETDAKDISISGIGNYSTSISIDDLVSIPIVPTNEQKIYSKKSTVSYTNTCPAGFLITMSTNSDSNDLAHKGNASATSVIPSIKTGTALTNNTWGFSLDNGKTYAQVPTQSAPATLLDASEANDAAKTFDVTFGVKINDTIPSGIYSTDVLYTVTSKPDCFTYKIELDFNDGMSAPYTLEIPYGNKMNLSGYDDVVFRTGYDFAGWKVGDVIYVDKGEEIDVNPGNEPVIYAVAQWKPVTYSISYDYNGGTGASGVQTTYNVESDSFTLKNPTRAGYTFTGWTGSNGTTPQKTVTIAKGSMGNKTYKANWTINTYTVKFYSNSGFNNKSNVEFGDLNGFVYHKGEGDALVGYAYGGKFTSMFFVSTDANAVRMQIVNTNVTPNKNYYTTAQSFTYKGRTWYVSDDPVGITGSGIMLQSNYAVKRIVLSGYTEYSNRKIMNASGEMQNIAAAKQIIDGAASDVKTQTFTYNVEQKLRANTFRRTNSNFVGWSEYPTGPVKYTDEQAAKNLTTASGGVVELYAVWD